MMAYGWAAQTQRAFHTSVFNGGVWMTAQDVPWIKAMDGAKEQGTLAPAPTFAQMLEPSLQAYAEDVLADE